MNANKQDAGGLLPCPFCGADAEMNHRMGGQAVAFSEVYMANCSQCGVNHEIWEDEDEAAERWNRRNGEQCRAASVASAEVDDLIVELENMGEQEYDAGCCNANYPIAAATRCMRDAAKLLRALSRGVPEGE